MKICLIKEKCFNEVRKILQHFVSKLQSLSSGSHNVLGQHKRGWVNVELNDSELGAEVRDDEFNCWSLICDPYIEMETKFPSSFDRKIVVSIVLANAKCEWRLGTKSLLAPLVFGTLPAPYLKGMEQRAFQMLKTIGPPRINW